MRRKRGTTQDRTLEKQVESAPVEETETQVVALDGDETSPEAEAAAEADEFFRPLPEIVELPSAGSRLQAFGSALRKYARSAARGARRAYA
ncbi:MAG: hypothetical protein ACE10D_01750, partial [Planctomycetota bacterium]